MRKISIVSIMVLALMIIANLSLSAAAKTDGGNGGEGSKGGSSDTLLGYKVEGNNITFTFNVKDYASFDEIESVTIAGEFNGWDPNAPDWQATDDDGDGIWIFTTTLDSAPAGSKFKFVTNGVDWQQPAADKLDQKYLADDGFGGFNLVIVTE